MRTKESTVDGLQSTAERWAHSVRRTTNTTCLVENHLVGNERPAGCIDSRPLTVDCRLVLKHAGVTLIEVVVFIVVISIGLTAMVSAFNYYISNSVDPIVQIRALECAQAKLDEIQARKFDENSPSGGIPACGSAEVGAVPCAGIVADPALDDVGDFNGQVDNSKSRCSVSVNVTDAGNDFGVPNDQIRRITVDATSPVGGQATLTTYRANF